MAVTLGQQVERVRSILNQETTNRPMYATFKGWSLDAGNNKVGIQLADVPVQDKLNNVIVELGTELVYVTSYDPATSAATCPPWFRQQMGSPANDSYSANSRAVIDPLWSTWAISQAVTDGMSNLYPDLFVVKTTTLTTVVYQQKYLLPLDCEEVLNLKIEGFAPTYPQLQLNRWTVDTKAADGNRYLHITTPGISGRNLYVTYRAKPTIPDPSNLTATWTSTGLPDSASNLPVLYAVAILAPAADAARTQSYSIEQSERSKYTQAGTPGIAVSRNYMQMYEENLSDEKRKLLDRFPPRVHFSMNG